MKGVTDPYILVSGPVTACKECALVCNGKIQFKMHSGFAVINMLLVLIGFCHLFQIEYNPSVKEAMEFMQEKLLGIVETRHHSTAYMNLFRTVSCLQEQREMSVAESEGQKKKKFKDNDEEEEGIDIDASDGNSDVTVLDGQCDLQTQLSLFY